MTNGKRIMELLRQFDPDGTKCTTEAEILERQASILRRFRERDPRFKTWDDIATAIGLHQLEEDDLFEEWLDCDAPLRMFQELRAKENASVLQVIQTEVAGIQKIGCSCMKRETACLCGHKYDHGSKCPSCGRPEWCEQ